MTTRTELKETYEENIKDLINDYFEFHNYEKNLQSLKILSLI